MVMRSEALFGSDTHLRGQLRMITLFSLRFFQASDLIAGDHNKQLFILV